MNVDYNALDELFRLQDIEGLIALGVPDDEYEPEVEKIFGGWPTSKLNPQNRVPHISILRCGHSRKARTRYAKIIPRRSGSPIRPSSLRMIQQERIFLSADS
jgi:hypothetical protein